MVSERIEAWGRIIYDASVDEFDAEICRPFESLRIDRPISVGCLVTGKCNLRCKFCYGNDESLPQKELSAEEWKGVFHRLRSWGVMRVDLSGGEPTVRNDIGEISKNALLAGLNVVLSTNGIIWAEKGPQELPLEVRIHVSLDSGFPAVHESSRLLRSFRPSKESFTQTSEFIRKCLTQRFKVRALTCVGQHNLDGLFQLGEHLASLGVKEWNISRVLPAGRALQEYKTRWLVDDKRILEQISDVQSAFRWMRIRYSNRTQSKGYFLLLLPDGTLATQYTDDRDKVVLGSVFDLDINGLRNHPEFDLPAHGAKWIASAIGCQGSFCKHAA